jgi:hypothetical protein
MLETPRIDHPKPESRAVSSSARLSQSSWLGGGLGFRFASITPWFLRSDNFGPGNIGIIQSIQKARAGRANVWVSGKRIIRRRHRFPATNANTRKHNKTSLTQVMPHSRETCWKIIIAFIAPSSGGLTYPRLAAPKRRAGGLDVQFDGGDLPFVFR